MLIWLNGQSTGVTTIANIAPLLFKSLGYDVTLQLGLSVVWVFSCQIGTIFSTQLIERLGRVKSLGTFFPVSNRSFILQIFSVRLLDLCRHHLD